MVIEHKALRVGKACGGCLCQGPSQSCDGSESNDRLRDGETP